MGNQEEKSLKIDLINLDMEEIKINRELYNIQMQINAKLAKDKKIKLKKNYKQFAHKKLIVLEEKKKLLFETEENTINANKEENNKNNKKENTIKNKSDKKEDNEKPTKNKDNDNKFSLKRNSSKENKNNFNKSTNHEIEKLYEKKELISNSEKINGMNIKTIYTRKKSKLCNNDKDNNEEKIENNENDIEINKGNGVDNNRYDKIKNKNELENLNINQYKRLFFDKLSSMGPRTCNNKSMDNKNASIVEELEVVGLSQNDILKDKLSEFFVGTSVASSSVQNKNISYLLNNYYKNKAKSEISGMNRQLIRSSKDNSEKNEFNNSTSYNYNVKINYEQNENDNLENFERKKNKKTFFSGNILEKIETEETFNQKSGNNAEEKYNIENQKLNINDKKMLKNNRNKSFFFLEDSYIKDNSSIKESNNMK